MWLFCRSGFFSAVQHFDDAVHDGTARDAAYMDTRCAMRDGQEASEG